MSTYQALLKSDIVDSTVILMALYTNVTYYILSSLAFPIQMEPLPQAYGKMTTQPDARYGMSNSLAPAQQGLASRYDRSETLQMRCTDAENSYNQTKARMTTAATVSFHESFDPSFHCL